jgi:hypothetical protein
MSDISVNSPLKCQNDKLLYLWLENATTSAVQYYKGQGVCYNFDYGVDTVVDASRYNRVITTASACKAHFAGVLKDDYLVPPGGTFVEVYGPGSVCQVRLGIGVSTTIGATDVVCSYSTSVGNFIAVSAEAGIGVATALQTITGDSAVHLCLAVLQGGVQSGLKS